MSHRGNTMTQSTGVTAGQAIEPLEEIREHLDRALKLMDELRPSSIAAARLQHVVDELDQNFGSLAKN